MKTLAAAQRIAQLVHYPCHPNAILTETDLKKFLSSLHWVLTSGKETPDRLPTLHA